MLSVVDENFKCIVMCYIICEQFDEDVKLWSSCQVYMKIKEDVKLCSLLSGVCEN